MTRREALRSRTSEGPVANCDRTRPPNGGLVVVPQTEVIWSSSTTPHRESDMIARSRQELIAGIEASHNYADAQIDPVAKACKRGCAHCCRQIIPVHAAEELVIAKYISSNMDSQARNKVAYNLKKWLQFFNSNTPNKTELSQNDINAFGDIHIKESIRCPFLLNEECNIYPVRPIICRTFHVSDSSAACKADPGRRGDPLSYIVASEAIDMVSQLAGERMYRLLPYAMANHFGLQHEIKKGISTLIEFAHQ